MTIITIVFDYPDVDLPKFVFGDRVAICDRRIQDKGRLNNPTINQQDNLNIERSLLLSWEGFGGSHPPKDWRMGKVVGFRWQEDGQVGWYYSVRLDEPFVYTEEYAEGELVESAKIPLLQAQWEQDEVTLRQQNPKPANEIPTPKFQAKSLVKFRQETGCDLLRGHAEVVGSRYVCNEDWSGWVYELKSEHLTKPLEIGEIWLELASASSTEATQIAEA